MEPTISHFDVVIVGAGLSGIGTAVHLRERCPQKSVALLESRGALGGTWDLFRYPGIRSDSDMHTLGYVFKPWKAEKAIADGGSILDYLEETADEHDVRRLILFHRRLDAASWSSDTACWTLEITRTSRDQGVVERETITCNLLLMCSGYYSYDHPHDPYIEGQDDFEGPLVHAQLWPRDLNYEGKRVIVVGSGATAMTLVPAIAESAAHVTMLQRSPTYVASRPDTDAFANWLRRWLPETWAYSITRFRNIQLQGRLYERSRSHPEQAKRFLLQQVRKHLGPDFDVDKHFTPTYAPWDQRLCLIPNADLFERIKSGKASVVTDRIARITKSGILLRSGEQLDADIIIKATGLNLTFLGNIVFQVDGRPVRFRETFAYKGMMYSDVPNMIQTFGYINASWTLRVDLTAEWTCRLVNHLDEIGMRQATPRLRDADKDMHERPWIDDFSAGYMQRVMDDLPRQGDRAPWLNTQSYRQDKKMCRKQPIDDGVLQFSRPT